MITFLFWNLKHNDRLQVLARLVKLHSVDFVMLAECSLGIGETLRELNSAPGPGFHYNDGICEKITIYSKFPTPLVRPIHEESRMSIRHLILPGAPDLMLAVVHLGSKLHNSDSSQLVAVTRVATSVERKEQQLGHRRTVLVGDLNMNPFEHGVVAAGGLHATMDRKIAARMKRTIGGKEYAYSIILCGACLATLRRVRQGRTILNKVNIWFISGICSIKFFFDPISFPCLKIKI